MGNPTIQSRLQVLETNSRNVYRQVSNLLDWAKVQRESIKADIKEVNINKIFSDLETQLSSSLKRKSILLNFDNQLTKTISSDENILKAIISNLIYNSIKFSDTNSNIDIRCAYCKNDKVCITIQDYGIGMPEVVRNRLFDISHIDHRKGTEDEPGTGLGLIIVKELIDALEGKIEVQSKEGKGTRISMQIPL